MKCDDPKKLTASKLRHKITIKQLPDPTDPANQNEYGEPDETWATVVTLWASMEPVIGREYYAAEGANSEAKIKFRARYTAAVKNEMRVYHKSDVYEIIDAINVEGKNRELLIYAKRVE